MAQEVYMDIPRVEKLSKDFKTFGEVLDMVAKALEALSLALKSAALFSFGGTAAAAAYIDRIKPNVRNASTKMKELSNDINKAITSYRTGDSSAAGLFG
ncbi:MAG: hypothetical protein C0410_06215 [Anaerolinea sp.]|nr:hypothetical protein [Anaerolinea sp.]